MVDFFLFHFWLLLYTGMSTKYTLDQLKMAVKESKNYKELCLKLGNSGRGGNRTFIANKLRKLGISTNHFNKGAWNKGLTYTKKCTESYLHQYSDTNSHSLKLRLLKEGYFKEQCSKCYLSSWLGGKMPLELNHINGVHTDNRLENLEIICPNCHSQTSNYRGKKNKL